MFIVTPIVLIAWGTSGVSEWVNVGTEFQRMFVAGCKFCAAFLTTALCARRVLRRIKIRKLPGGGRGYIACYGCIEKATPVRRLRQIRFGNGLSGSWGGSVICMGVKHAVSKSMESVRTLNWGTE